MAITADGVNGHADLAIAVVPARVRPLLVPNGGWVMLGDRERRRVKQFANGTRGLAITLLAAGLAVGGARAEGQLEGAWLAEDASQAGVAAPEIVGHRLDFKGDRFRITKAGTVIYGGIFSVDASAQPPAIEFDLSETPSLAGVWRGIYALKGDTLTICDNAPDRTMPRPNSFAECVAPGYVVIRFTRLQSGIDPRER